MAQYNNGYPAPAGAGAYGQTGAQYSGGMGAVGATPPLSGGYGAANVPRTMGYQQTAPQEVPVGLLGRPVSSREEFLAIPSDLYGRGIYCPDLRNGVIYYKRLNPETGESDVGEYYSPQAWQAMQQAQAAQQAQRMQAAAPAQDYVLKADYNELVQRVNELDERLQKPTKTIPAGKKGDAV